VSVRRRELLQGSVLAMAGASAAAWPARARAQAPAKEKPAAGRPPARPEVYELRAYRLQIGAQPKIVGDFLAEVYLPLLNRLGASPVGAFTVTFGPEMPTIYVLAPFASLAAYGEAKDRLTEELHRQQGAAALSYLRAPGSSPAYLGVDSQLLVAFDSFPRLEVPAAAAKKEPRIFELRTYRSPGELAHARKMEMFTPRLGELDIFRRAGLQPVLFARTLVGPRLPSFSYMLTFPDLAAREAAWKRFREDPAWLKLKATPGYTDADVMANISDLVLAPTAYSQI
jgi:hypothetical protein